MADGLGLMLPSGLFFAVFVLFLLSRGEAWFPLFVFLCMSVVSDLFGCVFQHRQHLDKKGLGR